MEYPFVSVIIPVRNEEKFVGKCLESLLNNDYPKDRLEIIVVDGMSEDGTKNVVEGFKTRFSNIKILKNPYKYTPHALNIGIKNSKGDVFMVAGAHTTYSKNYIRECVSRIEKGYDVVGGVVKTVPSSSTTTAKAIARVLSHPFGVGGAKYRTLEKTEGDFEVDTVAYALYRKDLVERVGYFNENLIRNQDIEYNLRIKRNGGRILLTTKAKAFYHARDNLIKLWKNNFSNGFWVIWSLKFADVTFSLRHVVPMLFVLFLITGGMLSGFSDVIFHFYASVLLLYLTLIVLSSAQISYTEGDFKIFFPTMVIFPTLHISYGLGSLYALLRMMLPS